MTRRNFITQVARSVPFDNDNNGFESDNVQDAIEELEDEAFDNDLDKFQFAKQGVVSSNQYLLTLNNIDGFSSPDVLAFDMIFRKFSVSNSNVAQPFTLELYKADEDHNNRQVIYTETFSIANGNWTGHSGVTPIEQSILVEAGWGIYVQIKNVGNPKPSDLSVLVWMRQTV